MQNVFIHRITTGAVGLMVLAGVVRSLCAGEAAGSTPRAQPRLFPDYTGVTIPPNIAPLNFRIEEPGSRYRVEIRSTREQPLVITSGKAAIQIPLKAWRALLQANAGQPLYIDVLARGSGGEWKRFETVTNQIAREPIDNHLVYRLLKPLYNAYVHLGIYQRDLESFEQRPVLENKSFGGDCLNCHTFLNRNPSTFAVNIRTSNKLNPLVLIESNTVARVDKTMGYLSWHPSGRLIAFSANKLSFFTHTCEETRDVFDAKSDLGIYRVDSNTVVFPPAIGMPEWNETWPAWSGDGKHLYYCRTAPVPISKYRQVRYDLVRVSYDLEQDRWGEPEVMVSSRDTGLSACQPRVSPDGRLLLFCLCKWGNFPVYQASSDLYSMDLSTREIRRLDINSDQAESWHSWAGNSRWVVFSSKRLDGLFARPHFSYVDEHGQFHKPFLLPQENPDFYDSCLQTFNVPELVSGPVTIPQADLAAAILRPRAPLTPKTIGQPGSQTVQTVQGGEGQSRYPQQPE